jgi:transcriptional regulator with GAF, ATPase, and Fis domain
MKRGRFERAHQGTLFLDEIGELPAEAQTRLLRVLQEKEIERVGAHKPIHVNVRVIAATHRNLEKMVGQNTFRKDLYYRLMVFPIVVPTLAQRKGDIPALAQYLIQKKVRQMNIGFTPILSQKGLQKLQDYNWPGNVRELENAIEREIILCRGNPLDFGNLSTKSVHSQAEPLTRNDEDDWCLDEVIKNHLNKVLAFTNGQVDGKGGAAALVGVNPSTLRSRMKKLGITRNATTLRKRK